MYKNSEPKLFTIKDKELSSFPKQDSFRLTNNKYICCDGFREKDDFDIEENIQSIKKALITDGKLHSGTIGYVSHFGNGKTFFLQYLFCTLLKDIDKYKEDKKKIYPVYLDISVYENQEDDLLVLLLAEIIKTLDYISNDDKTAKTNVSSTLKKILPSAFKIGTNYLLRKIKDSDNLVASIAEESGALVENLLESISREEKFIKQLEDYVSEEGSLIIILDNLDRCRPEFVLSVMVLLKRLFQIKGILFILAYDKQQIINMLSTLYGEKVDIQSYLKKYIAHEIYMEPYFNIVKFTRNNFVNTEATCFGEYTHETYEKTNNGGEKLAILWQTIYMKSTLSLRKYQQGFISINSLYPTLIDSTDKTLIAYVLMIYLKATYPLQYQQLYDYHYWNSKNLAEQNELKNNENMNDFFQNMGRVYNELLNNLKNVSADFPNLSKFMGDKDNLVLFKECRKNIEFSSRSFVGEIESHA